MTEGDSKVILARAPADQVSDSHAWCHRQSGYQLQRALLSIPEKRQNFRRTLYSTSSYSSQTRLAATAHRLDSQPQLTDSTRSHSSQTRFAATAHRLDSQPQLTDSPRSYSSQTFNLLWMTGVFPNSWREAFVIPVLKAGKSCLDPLHYRPIALTSAQGKLLEKLVNLRLTWHLERHGLLVNSQCGFRKHWNTVDHVARSYSRLSRPLEF